MLDSDRPVTDSDRVKELEERVRGLERDLESMTRKNEFLQETLLKIANNRLASRPILLSEGSSTAHDLSKAAELLKRKSKPSAL